MAFKIDKRKKVQEAELRAADQVGKAMRTLASGAQVPALVLEEGVTAEAIAFNAQARRTFRQRAESATRDQFNALALQHRGDPDGLQKAMSAYTQGAMFELDPIEQGYFATMASTRKEVADNLSTLLRKKLNGSWISSSWSP